MIKWNNKFKFRFFAASILFFIVGVGLFFHKYSITSNFQKLKAANSTVQEIKKMNANLSKSILKSRFYYLSHYDPFVFNIHNIENSVSQLEKNLLQITVHRKNYLKSIQNIKKNISDNNKNLELFKSQNSIYKNSEHYLPTLITETLQNHKLKNNFHIKNNIEKLTQLLLIHISNPNPTTKNELTALQKKLEKLQVYSNNSQLKQIQRHLHILLKGGEQLDLLVKKLVANKVDLSLSILEKKISQDIINQEKLSHTYDILMISLIVLLVSLVLFTLFKLKKAKCELELKVAERTQELVTEKEKSDQALETKARFLATMSHEIRTPMNAVLSCTNLLLDSVKKPEHIRLVKTIGSSGDTLLTIINDILDFSKIESGKIDLEEEPFSIEENLKETIDLLSSKASEKGVTVSSKIQTGTLQWAKGDVTRFRQVLTNLIGNAVKFTKTRVDIKISSKPQGSKHEVLVSVTDNGIGMPKEAKSKLFKDFSQVDASTTRKFGGTGLGLAICKGLVEAMGGHIWAESEINVGSTFYFTFITEAIEGHQTKKQHAFAEINPEMAQTHPLKILMAEDNSINQMVAKKIIGKLGYRIDIVGNGLEAVEAVKSNQYDIVLMDQHMPEMDGVEATKVIRKIFKSKDLKIFALTASAFKEDKDRCLNAGMDGFLTKPININQLVAAFMECEPNFSLKLQQEQPTLIDKEALFVHFEGSHKILAQMSQQLLKELPEVMNLIQTAIIEKNTQALGTSTHKLKGSLSDFQVDTVLDTVLKLEIIGKKGQFNEAQVVFKNLTRQVSQFTKELETLEIHSVA